MRELTTMSRTIRALLVGTAAFGALLVGGAPLAQAQMSTSGGMRSLRGYGGAAIDQYYSGSMSSYMPYNGNTGGFVSYQGGQGGMGMQPLTRGLPETPIGGVSMGMTHVGGASRQMGAMTDARGGAMGAVQGGRMVALFGSEAGVGMGAMQVGTPMTQRSRMRRAPSGLKFGYPFRMPADFPGAAIGMAVMAP
jgi:hypothetical protein